MKVIESLIYWDSEKPEFVIEQGDDGLARIYVDGTLAEAPIQSYGRDFTIIIRTCKGVLHHFYLPAYEFGSTKHYYRDGLLHRANGLPAKVSSGIQCRGETPRESREWYELGKLHRVGGPALEYPWSSEPDTASRYYLEGVNYEYKEFFESCLCR